MPSLIASTLGMWLVAVFLQSLLHGMGLLQGFLYFVWYPMDSGTVKGTVIAVLLTETVQMAGAFLTTYRWLIDGFGTSNFLLIRWPDMLQLTALYLSTFIAQVQVVSYRETSSADHFQSLRKNHTSISQERCVSAHPYSSPGSSGICVWIIIAQVIIATRLGDYRKIDETATTTNLQAGAALAADIAITGGLFWRFSKSRTGVQSTNRVLNFLIMTAINRGVLTMLSAIFTMVLFLTQPGSYYFMITLLLSDKFYMNNMLAMKALTLNGRCVC
ncbi:hypothetical protein MSAN_01067800 [Mycena sanguinolenta]|uniref:DUF6534 domain-containing protein n=1 Tax=Mycena sanguinolenta TaxID=230812 RepID=A0A8H7D6H1_9AGAR|nr:hypothetical protein MSAN_01067800 [Mycena sanguinolenta]